jgi:glycosyltransferase involved in cell wall biosynthesis
MIYISTFENLKAAPGIRKKIYSQARWFAHYINQDVDIILTKDQMVYREVITQNGQVLHAERLFEVNSIFDKSRYYKKLVRDFQRVITGSSVQTKIAYIRTVLYDKYFLKLLEMLKQQEFKVVLEIPTSTFVKEYINNFPNGWYKFFNFLMYHKKIYQLADLIVSIGEIPFILKDLERKVVVIGNGIDLSEIPKITPPKFEKELHLIGVANVAYWHGYDRVIKGLGEYYNHHKDNGYTVVFHVVGEGSELKKLKKLVQKYSLSDKVIFHGTKFGNDLINIYRNSHIAIGSLGLHRIKFGGNPIKHREYCAMGIPFVAEANDLDFPDDFPFMLKVPADDSPINIQQLITFYTCIRENYPNYPHIMRKYAENTLTWRAKIQKIMEHLI